MTFELFESVVLTVDLPEHGLRASDLGTVVEIYSPDGLEVEFVTTSGLTQAIVTLPASSVRKVEPDDIVTVRPAQPAA